MNFLFRFPFNTQTKIGFIVAVILQLIGAMCIFSFVAIATALGFEAIILFMAIIKDLKDNLKLINKMGKRHHKHAKMMESMIKFLHLHADVKELCDSIRN